MNGRPRPGSETAEGKRHLLLLVALAFVVRLGAALCISRPGYMDAAYYAAGGCSSPRAEVYASPSSGYYLTNPTGMPHHGFLCWMPLPSVLAAAFSTRFRHSFLALQVSSVGPSALVRLVAFGLAWHTAGDGQWALETRLLAGS